MPNRVKKQIPSNKPWDTLIKSEMVKLRLPKEDSFLILRDIPGYCYIVCDLTEKMIHLCKSHDLQETSDHMGYFGFHKQYGAYVEVISFDRLVDSAKKRHRAFFDKLGLPTS